MIKKLAVFNCHHARVTRYYSRGEWHEAPEDTLVFAKPVPSKRGRKGHRTEFMLTRDVEAGGVYDECGYLMGYGEEEVTFEELEAAAKATNWYGHGVFDRRVLIFVGGRQPLRPALITFAGNQLFRWSTSVAWVIESLNTRFSNLGLPPANAMEVDHQTVLFDFDAEIPPTV